MCSLGQQNTGISLMSDVCSPLRKNDYQVKCALAFYREDFFDNNDWCLSPPRQSVENINSQCPISLSPYSLNLTKCLFSPAPEIWINDDNYKIADDSRRRRHISVLGDLSHWPYVISFMHSKFSYISFSKDN